MGGWVECGCRLSLASYCPLPESCARARARARIFASTALLVPLPLRSVLLLPRLLPALVQAIL